MSFLKSICICILLLSYVCTYEDEEFTTSSKFYEVIKSPFFVDKTLLLKEILKHNCMLITAPKGFMKSTNLDMIKSFLTLPLTEKEISGNVTDVDIVKVNSFKDFRNLSIYKSERRFFYKYVGKFPVVHLDLNVDDPISTYEESESVIMRQIHLAYLEHSYVCGGFKLKEREKIVCRTWCDVNQYETLSTSQFYYGLSNLVRYLYSYHRHRRVYVLVDNYDALVRSAMFKKENKFRIIDVIHIIVGQIAQLLKGKQQVRGCVITGSSFIASAGFSLINELKSFKFLNHDGLVDFYGFTEAEVESALKKPICGGESCFKLSTDQINKARSYYGAYNSVLGRRIYNPISIVNFLKSGRIENYWLQTGDVTNGTNLEILFAYPSFKSVLERLLRNKAVPIDIPLNSQMRHLNRLRKIFDMANFTLVPNVNIPLLYLHELGYLSFTVQNKTNETLVRITNTEIWNFIFDRMTTYYYNNYQTDYQLFKRVNRLNFDKWFKVFSGFVEQYGDIDKSLNEANNILF